MIRLEKVDWDNYGKVLKLNVRKDQEDFVAPNDISLIHAFLALSDEEPEPVWAFAIYHDDEVVGFIQICYNDDWTGYERDNWLESDVYKKYEDKPYYSIWRFMIDEKHQGKGYGKAAMKKALDFIKTFPAGKAKYALLIYVPPFAMRREFLFTVFGYNKRSSYEKTYCNRIEYSIGIYIMRRFRV